MVILECIKINFFLFNAALLNAILLFISQSHLPLDKLNFSTCLMPIPFVASLQIDGHSFFDSFIVYVFFAINDNARDWLFL